MLSVSVLAAHGANVTDVLWKPDQKVDWLPSHKTYKPEETKEGWIVLGSHCFPYTPASSATNGMMDLRLELNGAADMSSIPETYEVMLYDDEPSGWPAFQKLPKKASCADRKKLAKNYEKRGSFTVNFKKQSDDTWAWNLLNIKVNEKATPRFWYLVLINCNVLTNTYKPIAPLTYDFKATILDGYYNKLTGPTICYSTHTWDGLTQNGLIVGIVVCVLIDLILAFFVRRHYKRMKAGQGHATIGQIDDDAENNLNLDDVNMLRSDTTRSDAM